MSHDNIYLAPFTKGQQSLLKIVDASCQTVATTIKAEVTRQKLAGEQPQLDEEKTGWMNIISAYGILYNRCVEAGWIDDVVRTKEIEDGKASAS